MATITFGTLKATKSDINRLERELIVLKWMVGMVIGGVVALVLKTFFPAI